MPRFLPKPVFQRSEITALLNAYEEADARHKPKGYQRKIWNRKNTRTFLKACGLVPLQERKGCKTYYTLAQIRELAPDVVNSMMDLDALEDATSDPLAV